MNFLVNSEYDKNIIYIYIIYMSFTGDFKGLLIRLIDSNESIPNNLSALNTELRNLVSAVGDVSIGILAKCDNGGIIVKKIEQTSSGIIAEDTQANIAYASFDLVNQTMTYFTTDSIVIADIPLEDAISGNYLLLSDPIIVQLYTDILQGTITASLYDSSDNLLKSCVVVDRDYNIFENEQGSVDNIGLLLTNIANQSKLHTNQITKLEKLKSRTKELAGQHTKLINRTGIQYSDLA
jgi:hypothetical protein